MENKIIMKIILGSQSRSRRKVLEKLGYEFEVMPADIDEKAIRFDDPTKLTLVLARAKADVREISCGNRNVGGRCQYRLWDTSGGYGYRKNLV